MRRRNAASNSPASELRRFGSSTVARFVLISFIFSLLSQAVWLGLVLLVPGLRNSHVDKFCHREQLLCLPVHSPGLPLNKQAFGHAPPFPPPARTPVSGWT